jgi:SNF family Na+-dependent transporter
VLAVFPALSTNVLSGYRIGDRGILELLDASLINWCLPIAALIISQIVAWMLKRELMSAEFVDPAQPGSERLFRHWIILLRYVATPVVLIALVLQLISIF